MKPLLIFLIIICSVNSYSQRICEYGEYDFILNTIKGVDKIPFSQIKLINNKKPLDVQIRYIYNYDNHGRLINLDYKGDDVAFGDKEIREQGLQIKKEDTIFMKNGKLDISKLEKVASSSGSTIPPYYQYESYLEDGTYIYISGDSESGYGKKLKFKNDHFFKYGFNYSPSGELKGYGIQYPNFFKKGIWYDYNENGNVEKYNNHDAPYKFRWEDVQALLKENKIKKEDIYQIGRGVEKEQYLWYISFKTKELKNTDKVKDWTLDGKTGEILITEIRDSSRMLD